MMPIDVSAKLQGANTSTCPDCGAALRCGMVAGDAECWCFSAPHVIPVPKNEIAGLEVKASCLCPACLQKLIAKQ